MERLDSLWICPADPSLSAALPPSLWRVEEYPCFSPRVAEYCRRYEFDRRIRRARIFAMADVSFRLWVNGEYVGTGPLAAGGDIFTSDVLPHCYPCTYELQDLPWLDFSVLVVAAFMKQADFSSSQSGLSLLADLELEDGERVTVTTDESWQVRHHGGYTVSREYNRPYRYDGTVSPLPLSPVRLAHSRWRAREAMIPMPVEEETAPLSVTYDAETKTALWDYDRIYAAYIEAENPLDIPVTVRVITHETPGLDVEAGEWTLAPREKHRGLKMYSTGGVRVVGEGAQAVKITLYAAHYPYGAGGSFECSDEGLCRLYDVCRHTMRICRQSWHLDSPRHQEPLGCTGDYYIETLMCAMADGDMRLSKQDLVRTAELLLQTNGKMFHTSYSLIFVKMLEEVYLFTGDEALLRRCFPAAEMLFDRFEGYHGEEGLLEFAPDYMFLDWQTVDGYSLHHPPMALGQTALCAFLYASLLSGARIAEVIGNGRRARICRERADALKAAMWKRLYSEKDGAFLSGFAGARGRSASRWLPENPDKTYVTLHANALCVWAGVAEGEECRRIFRRVADDGTLPDYQPYFAHFVLEAAEKVGLYREYGFPMMARFVKMADACPKGLQEGWLTPPEGYGFDHSHAWGGTPAWQLPVRVLGLCIEEAGMKKLSISPCLFGLRYARVKIPVPGGHLRVFLEEGKEPVIEAPEGVSVALRESR